MKNTDLENQVKILNQELRSADSFKQRYEEVCVKLSNLQRESESSSMNQQEKVAILRDLEGWRSKALSAEARAEEVEIDIKGLIIENERLNSVILNLHSDIEQFKLTVKELQKNESDTADLEQKLKFYINENDKLNRILLNRSQQYY